MDLIKQVLEDWNWTRGLTYKFIDSIPNDKLSFSPGKEFGTIVQQLRHMGAVQECYIIGLETGKIDFSKKRKDKKIESSKKNIKGYLKKLDIRQKKILNKLSKKDLDKIIEWKVWEDIPNPTTHQVLLYLIQHETFHQGILQLYASLARFKTVRFF